MKWSTMNGYRSSFYHWEYILILMVRLMENTIIEIRLIHFNFHCTSSPSLGTALYMSISACFIAQLNGVTLGLDSLFIILITSTALSMAIPTIPSASVVMLLVVLGAVDLDPSNVSLLFGIDWIMWVPTHSEQNPLRSSFFMISTYFRHSAIASEPLAMCLTTALQQQL